MVSGVYLWFLVSTGSMSLMVPGIFGSFPFLMVPGVYQFSFWVVPSVYRFHVFGGSQFLLAVFPNGSWCLLAQFLFWFSVSTGSMFKFPVTVVLHFLDGSRCLLVPFLVGSHCLLYALHALYGSWCLLAKANGFFKLVFIFKFQILVVPSVCWVHVHCLWCFLCWQIQQIICCV